MLKELVKSLQSQCKVDVIGPYTEDAHKTDQHVFRPQHDGLFWFFVAALVIGWRLSRKNRYDYIMTGSALVIPIAYLLSRMFNYQLAVQIHGLDVIYRQFLYQLMIRVFLPRCDLLFANSQRSKMHALERGVSAAKIKVINPGIHFAEFAEVSEPIELYQKYKIKGRQIILSAGRLAPRKGIAEFTRYVLPEVIRTHPDVLFIIVGDNPTNSLAHKENVRAQVEDAVNELHLNENVLLLGRVERHVLIHLYHACHLFVLPAIDVAGDMEGFGIVLLEASAAGKPVVSSRIGGIPDAVVDGQSGILVRPGNWSEMVNAIVELLRNDDQRMTMGLFGRDRAQSELDWTMVGRRYLEELQNESQR